MVGSDATENFSDFSLLDCPSRCTESNFRTLGLQNSLAPLGYVPDLKSRIFKISLLSSLRMIIIRCIQQKCKKYIIYNDNKNNWCKIRVKLGREGYWSS